ncbi:MAG TPA: LysR family transcriptional regulator [Labilithrix sp.]|jgi:DNA-binding transcriptional LysR family regulator
MHDVHVDLALVAALRALLAEKHVTRAAKRLGVTQPAMSHSLARLRAALGDPILVRTPSGMRATPRAEAMIEPLERAFHELDAALAPPAAFDPARATNRFVVATTDYVELVLLPALCARLWREAPNVDLRVVTIDTRAHELLAEDRLDLAIGPPGTLGSAGTIRSQLLFRETFRCVMREGHPAARRRLTLDAFIALPHALIAPRGESGGGVVDHALARMKKKRRVALEIPHFLVAPYVIGETDLVITLAARVAERFASTLGLVSVAPPVELPGFAMAMAWHERRHVDPAHAWFRKLVADVAREA